MEKVSSVWKKDLCLKRKQQDNHGNLFFSSFIDNGCCLRYRQRGSKRQEKWWGAQHRKQISKKTIFWSYSRATRTFLLYLVISHDKNEFQRVSSLKLGFFRVKLFNFHNICVRVFFFDPVVLGQLAILMGKIEEMM